ncbi:Pol polyprotein [Plakobranchus ocellatus]|uniref:Pol polyprotein n=1 Tax=Plakobranchus ocellatus TaxID=259542 RepID=A0AAV3Z4E6_9GAST|nr:Pol polyprotein [Plakobranchus ocellatus]
MKVCRRVREVHEESEDEFRIDAAKVDNDESKLWVIKLKIRESIVQFKIGTGADIIFISDKTFRQLMNKPKLKKSRISLTSPGGKLAVAGEFNVTTKMKSKAYKFKVVVVKNSLCNNLLSRKAAVTFLPDPDTEREQALTICITPIRDIVRQYCVPMGISLGPECFQTKMTEYLKGQESCEAIMDEKICLRKDIREAGHSLERCARQN